MAEKKALEKESEPLKASLVQAKSRTRLRKIVAELELDKLILKESLDFLKPKA